jgi:hypothetical protein
MLMNDDGQIFVVKFGDYRANNNKSYNNEDAYGFYIEYILPSELIGIIDHATRIQYAKIVDEKEIL